MERKKKKEATLVVKEDREGEKGKYYLCEKFFSTRIDWFPGSPVKLIIIEKSSRCSVGMLEEERGGRWRESF